MSITVGFVSAITKYITTRSITLENSEKFSDFSLNKPLPIKLASYVEHFLYQLNCPDELLAISFHLLEKFLTILTQNNIHRIVFTALSLSYKFLIDSPVSNTVIEKVGSLKAGELKNLEKKLLKANDWEFGLDRYEETLKFIVKEGSSQENEEGKAEDDDEDLSFENQETDFTEYESNDSFSELSAFFSN